MPELLAALAEDDVLVLTADHGNDPTTPSTDHSREYVPLLIIGQPVRGGVNLGVRYFADLGATITAVFDTEATPAGRSFAAENGRVRIGRCRYNTLHSQL